MIKCKEPALFLADCHLPLIPQAQTQEWTPRVVRFLNSAARKASTVVLAGDIFDFWFEWKHSVPAKSFKPLAAMHNLVNDGIEIFYLAGNHDGHPGSFLRDEIGLRIFRGSLDLEINHKKIHVIHGDGLAKRDRSYRMLRSLVRWKPTEKIFRQIHPDWGIKFAAKLSNFSSANLSDHDKFGVAPYRDYAFRKIDEGFDYVVIGHRHSAERHEHNNGVFFSIGDWIEKGGYGWLENGKMELRHYEDKE